MDAWYVLAFGILMLFFYLFPSGRFASRFTLALAAALWLWLALGLIDPSYLPWNLPRLSFVLAGAGWIVTGVVALIYQYRNSGSLQRQQIRWIVWGAAASVLGLMLQILPLSFSMEASRRVFYDFILYPLGQVLKACLPLSIAFAILRYRLWNIELVVNRLLVYGSLTLLTMLGYLGTVFLLQALFTGLSNPVLSFVVIGSGRPAIRLRPSTHLRDCPRPAYRVYRMGGDVLFDCDLRADGQDEPNGSLEIRRVI